MKDEVGSPDSHTLPVSGGGRPIGTFLPRLSARTKDDPSPISPPKVAESRPSTRVWGPDRNLGEGRGRSKHRRKKGWGERSGAGFGPMRVDVGRGETDETPTHPGSLTPFPGPRACPNSTANVLAPGLVDTGTSKVRTSPFPKLRFQVAGRIVTHLDPWCVSERH